MYMRLYQHIIKALKFVPGGGQGFAGDYGLGLEGLAPAHRFSIFDKQGPSPSSPSDWSPMHGHSDWPKGSLPPAIGPPPRTYKNADPTGTQRS